MRNRHDRRIYARLVQVLVAGCLVLVSLGGTQAQIPDEFTNLKLLPKDIGKRELVGVMRSYASALGVRCKHCHVGESEDSLEGYDFASDEKETKSTTLAMMRMVDEINQKLLPATGRDDLIEVSCVSCHHGLARPQTLSARLLATVEEQDVEQAISLYRELREEHYGSAAYDFSPRTLNGVAETLVRESKNLEGAIAVMELNVELNPQEAYSHFLLGGILAQAGQNDAALASMQRAAELDPENAWYRQSIERLQGQ